MTRRPSPSPRRCSSSFTAARARTWRPRRVTPRTSPPSSAALTSPGPPTRASAAGCGMRAIARWRRRAPCGRAAGRSPPTSACPSPRSPSASRDPGDIAEHRLMASIVGHVGDGNFHVVCWSTQRPAEVAQGEEFHARLVRRALAPRHLHRRARRRLRQGAVPVERARAPGGRDDARDQARGRSRRDLQPGQDGHRRALTPRGFRHKPGFVPGVWRVVRTRGPSGGKSPPAGASLSRCAPSDDRAGSRLTGGSAPRRTPRSA